jgi:hypothetical protein
MTRINNAIKKRPAVVKYPQHVADKIRRVKEITREQLNLMPSTGGPQKNALHGKHKNSINRTLSSLEDEKNELLNSILNDGHDPEITSMAGDGTSSKMKLSEFLARTPPSSSEKNTNTKKINKFTVHQGGKDAVEATTTTDNKPTP